MSSEKAKEATAPALPPRQQAGTPHPQEEPPAYSSGPSTEPAAIYAPSPIPGLPNIEYSKYNIPNSETSKDLTTITTYIPALSSQPSALVRFLREQATLPPKPQVCIKGTHNEYGQHKVDFTIYLNMMSLIYRDPPNGWNYLKVIEEGELGWRGGNSQGLGPSIKAGTLEDWAKRFCADKGNVKSFALERQVINWGTEALEGRIRSLIATLGYRGHLDISFPVSHSKVVVHASNSIGTMFSLLVAHKRYEVVRSIWPYARSMNAAGGIGGDGSSQYAVQSEAAWWNDWKDAIARSILQRRVGWVSTEDRLQALMSLAKPSGQKWADWGMDR